MKKKRLPFYKLYWLIMVSLLLQACQSRPSTSIAFLSDMGKEDKQHILLMDIKGNNSVQIKTNLAEEGCPVWSPDGEELLFVSTNGTGNGIDREFNLYTIYKDGSKLKQLQDKNVAYSAAWSPDKAQIVFSGQDQNFVHIYVMDLDGSHVVQLTSEDSLDIDPRWSPDGKKILFSSNRSKGRYVNPYFSVFVMNADGNDLKQLTNERERAFNPTWAPDGKHIAFHAVQAIQKTIEEGVWYESDSSDIYVMDENGSNRTRLTKSSTPVFNVNPDWSSDGQVIVFASNRDHANDPDRFDIYTMDPGGSNMVRLTTSGNNNCPAWQPDEKRREISPSRSSFGLR